MKRRDGWLSAIGIILALSLLIGLSVSLLGSGRMEPKNPIDPQPDYLYPETMQGSGGQLGGEAGNGDSADATEETEPPTDPSEETKPEETQPEETQPEETQPEETKPEDTRPPENEEGRDDTTTPPTTPANDHEDHQGGDKPENGSGGSQDSEDPGNGIGGRDDIGGGNGGDDIGGDADNTPRIYTDLETKTLTRADLPDGKLHFMAYPVGEGKDLYVRVRLRNNTNTGNGKLLAPTMGSATKRSWISIRKISSFCRCTTGQLFSAVSSIGSAIMRIWPTRRNRKRETTLHPLLPIWTEKAQT